MNRPAPTARPVNPLLEITVTLLIPAVILMKLSGPEDLGAVNALLLALAFPFAWGVHALLRERKLNLLAVLGVVSVLLTGGIGLLELDAKWLAIKEAAVPGVIGLVVLASVRTRYPLVRTLLYNRTVLDVARVQAALDARGTAGAFENRLRKSTLMLAGTFFFSSAMNYFLATWVVVSPPGSPAFNEELGRLTLISYPMIALPSMLMMLLILYYLVRTIRTLAGLDVTDVLNTRKA
ncbi:MFS transporter [Betaproteobacteria bacterium SCN2]|jgi:hypothetical protein|nr:MFS transporter [Betaproteobacteria bacterium SCN2]